MKSKQPRTQARPRAFLGRFPLGPKSPALSRLQRLVPKDVKEGAGQVRRLLQLCSMTAEQQHATFVVPTSWPTKTQEDDLIQTFAWVPS